MVSRRTIQGWGGMALLGGAMAAVFAGARAAFPLSPLYRNPITNLDTLTGARPLAGAGLAAAIALLFAAYGLGAAWLRAKGTGPQGQRRGGWLVLAGFPPAFAAILILVYPITSIDLFDYAFRGRMLAHYQVNTFVRVPMEFQSDPLFWYVAWRRAVTAYGPLWEGMSWLTARLAGQSPGLSFPPDVPGGGTPALEALGRLLVGYKLLAALGFLLCGAAIWGALGRIAPEQQALGTYLWLWNPLALWETAGAGHNDAWMALLIGMAIWLFAWGAAAKSQQVDASGQAPKDSGRVPGAWLLAPVMLTLGGLIKYLALCFGPVLLAAELRRLPSWRARLRLVALGALACGGLVVLAYAPFWAGWGTLQNFGDRRGLFYASWLAALQATLTASMPKETAGTAVALLGLGLLLAGIAWATWRAWQAPGDIAGSLLWLLLWFLFVCNPWFQPWYLVWAVALVAVQPWRARAALGVTVFCTTALLSYLAGSFLLPLLGWGSESAAWNMLLTALIYGPPLLVFSWGEAPALPQCSDGGRRRGRWSALRRPPSHTD
jgi:hypothetical protein